MGSTVINRYTYPEGTDAPVVHTDLRRALEEVARGGVMRFANATERTAAFATLGISPSDGMLSYRRDQKAYETFETGPGWVTPIGWAMTARKPGDQGLVNAVLTDVTGMSLPVIASGVYDLHCRIIATGDDVNGVATAWTHPALATLADGQHSVRHIASGGASTAGDLDGRGLALAASPSTTLNHAVPDTNLVMVLLEGTLIVGANAGTLQLRASKVVATSGTDSTIKAGSMLRLIRTE